MSEIIRCPRCERQLRMEEEHREQMLECPSCHAQFRATLSPPAMASPAVAPDAAAIREGGPALEPAAAPVRDTGLDRRSHRRRAALERRTPRHRAMLVVSLIAGSVAALAVLAALINMVTIPPPPVRPRVREDQEKRRHDLLEAFRKQKPLDRQEIVAELKPLFRDLGDAFRSRNGERIVQFFDIERLLEEKMPPRGTCPSRSPP